jgi:hypothetical protein
MLQRSEKGEPMVLSTHGFILDVTVDQTAPDPEGIAQKIGDALMWVEGCGEVNVGYLGPMEPETEE